MKFENTMKKAETLAAQNKKLDTKMDSIINEIYGSVKNPTYRKQSEIEKGKKELEKLQNKILLNNIKRKILVNNSKYEFYTETKPIILEVMQKYNGKKYGEVTKQKIHDEILEKGNFYFYMSESSHNSHYSIRPNNKTNYYYSHSLELNTKYDDPKILENNTIIVGNFENFTYSYYEYIENIDEYAKEIFKAYKEAKKAVEIAREKTSNFNHLLHLNSDGIREIDYISGVKNLDYYI